MNWREHFQGKGGVIASLNQRLFLLRRLYNQLNKECLRKVAESLFISKIRYGLQLLGKVRTDETQAIQSYLSAMQKTQNKLVRFLNNVRISDCKLLRILTSERVLCMPFAGQNRLSDAKTTFSITNATK